MPYRLIRLCLGLFALIGADIVYAATTPDDVAELTLYATPRDVPPVLIQDLREKLYQLSDKWRGKNGLVINLWASWCRPCLNEMPTLPELERQLAAHNIPLIAISYDREGPVIRRFIEQNNLKGQLTIAHDPTMQSMRQLQIKGIPTTILINRDGKEVGRYLGEIDGADAKTQQEIIKILAGTPTSITNTPTPHQ
jgi:thiol-disulfide isomerase/thioredoxin